MFSESEKLWLRIQPVFESFAARVADANLSLIHSLASSTNSAFFLRAYLAFRKHNDGDELAITVDVKFADDRLTVESDVCNDSGEILAVGPSSIFTLDDLKNNTSTAVNDWLVEFEKFLWTEKDNILRLTANMS